MSNAPQLPWAELSAQAARSGRPAHTLRARLRNDRFGDEHTASDYARGWNDCSRDLERVLHELAIEEGLRELAEALIPKKHKRIVGIARRTLAANIEAGGWREQRAEAEARLRGARR